MTASTWIASISAAGTLVALAGLVRQIYRQNWLDRSEQARSVGGYLTADLQPEGKRIVTVTVVNSSQLPVRGVKGLICRASDRAVLTTVEASVVLPGAPATLPGAWINTDSDALVLVLEYDDDAGVRWRKYARNKALERIG